MRFSLYILLILLFPLSVQADMLRGVITAVDREKGEILLIPGNCRQCRVQPDFPPPPPPPGQEDRQQNPPITIRTTQPIPLFVKPEAFIRVWGYFSPDTEHLFVAERIAGPGWRRGGHDSTGVRSRLRKKCMRQERPPHGPMPPPPDWRYKDK
ncbi:MAG: hypothetical protein KQH63_06745 [Desulfobulbaceae bacterium]|nr:hypothetical protein [Desulfobulbaceae bacterium]